MNEIWVARAVKEGEEQGSSPGAKRRPPAEDHACQGDEAAPVGHGTLERTDRFEGEEGTRQPGQATTQDHVDIAHHVDINPHRIGSTRVLADGTGAQTPPGIEQHIMDNEDQDNGCVRDGGVFEKHPSNKRVSCLRSG